MRYFKCLIVFILTTAISFAAEVAPPIPNPYGFEERLAYISYFGDLCLPGKHSEKTVEQLRNQWIQYHQGLKAVVVADSIDTQKINENEKCIALLRVAARLTPPPPRASVRRGLKQRVLDMASGELLPHVGAEA